MTAPAPLPLTPYEAYLAKRCQDWREKFPDRAARLRPIVARLLGAPRLHRLDASWVGVMLSPVENEVIAAMQGWPDESSWQPGTPSA